jgi:sugar lactone lactonase YvrE
MIRLDADRGCRLGRVLRSEPHQARPRPQPSTATEMVANVTFGGAKRNRLFICGTASLYSVYLTTNGCKLG